MYTNKKKKKIYLKIPSYLITNVAFLAVDVTSSLHLPLLMHEGTSPPIKNQLACCDEPIRKSEY